ncbi:MAG: FHA domain-containing protein [Anaerolineales bacterium]|nr:FHA domain-containing protein [Anaerolineales bacterium]
MSDTPAPPFLVDPGGHRHLLTGERVRLGRGADNDVVVTSKRASRDHARILFERHRIWIEDLGSANGTWVNDERLTAPRELRDGDRLVIGDTALSYHDPNTTFRDPALAEIELDLDAGVVRVNRRIVSLSPKEFALLAHLYRLRGQVCTKADIGRAVWPDYKADVYDYQIENLVRRLRVRLAPDGEAGEIIETLRGHGYRLNGA